MHRIAPTRVDRHDQQPTTIAIAHALEDIALALMAALDHGRQAEADTIAGALGPDAIRTAQYVAAERIASNRSPVSERRILAICSAVCGPRARLGGHNNPPGSSARPIMLLGQGDYRTALTEAGWVASPEVRP